MRIYRTILFSILCVIGCAKKADYPWFSGSLDDAKAIAAEKLIMLDFYATW
jgi:hypothetical protein